MANQRLNIDIVARDKATHAIGKLQGTLSKVKGAVFNLQNAFIGLGTGLAIRSLVNTGKQIENLQVRLKFLFGTAQEGAKAFDTMVRFASKVPFSLEEIQQGAGVLSVVSKDADELSKIMEITGNVAAVTGLDFRTTAEQIQRSLSAGISSADLFREKGVKAMLGFSAGATVSVEQTVEAFERVFGKGGKFGKATDELAQTFEGTLSMIGDKLFLFKTNILRAGFFEGLKAEFGDLNKFFEENSVVLEETARKIGIGLAQAVIKLKDGIILLKENFDKVVTLFKILIAIPIASTLIKITTAVLGLTKAILKFNIASALSKNILVGLASLLAQGGAVYLAFKGIDKLMDEMGESFDNLSRQAREFEHEMSIVTGQIEEALKLVPLREFEHEMSVRLPSAIEKTIDKFKELNKQSLEELNTKLRNARDILIQSANDAVPKLSEGIARSVVLGEKLTDTFKKLAQDVLIRVLSFYIELGIRTMTDIALQKIKNTILDSQNRKLQQQTSELKKQQKIQGTMMLMTGNPLGFLGFMAKGGAVRKGQPTIVGEQGPELFIPNQTGQITQNARGAGGSPVNVNFSITTLDARGFEEMLVQNRGTISNIINQAVNERGGRNLI